MLGGFGRVVDVVEGLGVCPAYGDVLAPVGGADDVLAVAGRFDCEPYAAESGCLLEDKCFHLVLQFYVCLTSLITLQIYEFILE